MIAKVIRLNLIAILLILSFATTVAQSYVETNVAEIIVNGRQFSSPFAGGLNAPQFSNADFNNDGEMDVLIFDRIGGVILPMIRNGESLTYDPSYLENFPVIDHFLLMKDYNADGIADIFCFSIDTRAPGISVFKGKYTNNRLDFDLVVSDESDLEVLVFQLASGSFSNIAVLDTDLPSIEDIDGDGDMDIVTFNFLGGQVEYYQNLVVERGENLDGFFFTRASNCYGGIFETGLTEEISLPEFPGDCQAGLQTGEVSTRHAGSTVLNMDYDGDGDFELLLGDLAFNNITLLVNNAAPGEEAFLNEQILRYPNEGAEAVDISVFPSPFYADMNGDGIRDFVAAPNNINNAFDIDNVWYYINVGEDNNPVFELVTKSLFVQDMLDLGTGTSPTFVDVNNDNLLDMVVGTETTFLPFGDRDGRLFLFTNVGTSTDPIFELTDDNWLDFQRFNSGAFQWSPTFADVDNDGDMDLYVGERNGNIYHAENLSGPNAAMDFGPITPNYMGIDVGQVASPTFFDMDRDGLLDMVIGERNGNINFLRNIGTASEPSFNPDLDSNDNITMLGQISTLIPGFVAGHSRPEIVIIDGLAHIAVGSLFGNVKLYEINDDLNSEFQLVNESLGNIHVGEQIDPAFADLNNDGILEAVFGNRRGGLNSYTTDIAIISTSTNPIFTQKVIRLRSNLISDYIHIDDNESTDIQVFNTLGQLVIAEKNTIELDLSKLSPGVYFVRLEREGQGNTEKIIVGNSF